MVLKYNLTSRNVEAVDTSKNSLTSAERLEALFAAGHRLEASAAQALLVEAMALHYLLSRIQADGITVSENPKELLTRRRLTFGRIQRLLSEPGGVHDASLGADLARYVELRNELAHHLVGRALTIDLDQFFGMGRSLIDRFVMYMHEIIRRHGKSNAADDV